MKKIKTTLFYFVLITFLHSCGGASDAAKVLKNEKITNTAEQLAETSWSLSEDKQTLTKILVFNTKQKRQEYQEAVERAWALINHLDYRVKTQEGQTIEL